MNVASNGGTAIQKEFEVARCSLAGHEAEKLPVYKNMKAQKRNWGWKSNPVR
jgi:hypothetical protein